MTKLCAFCRTPLTKSNRTREHIIPNAIGGHKKIRNFICKRCNDKTGEKWDSELASQLRALCTMLDIKRDRDNNRQLSVETISGRKLTLNSDGSLTNPEVTVDKSTVGDKTHFQIRATSIPHLKKIMSKMTKKKYPDVDIDRLLMQAIQSQEPLQEPIHIHVETGGALAGRSIVKSCLALAYEAGLTIDDCENAKRYLLQNREACFGYYNETDPITNRPHNIPLHCVYVRADTAKGLVLAYVEYFGFQKIVACLSDNYSGPTIERCYGVNPLTGEELDVDVDLTLEKNDISSIYNYEKWDYGRAKYDMENTLLVWKEIDNGRVIERVVNDAIDDACSELGIREGDVLSDERILEFSDYVFCKFAPTLLRIKFGQSFTHEEIQAIMGIVSGSLDEKN